jgi:hypothetical protein
VPARQQLSQAEPAVEVVLELCHVVRNGRLEAADFMLE